MKAKSLLPVFTETVPSNPAPGNLYISMRYETAVHLCACGCGTKVVTPFGHRDWTLTFNGSVSLSPSVGNGQQPCRSHYYVRHDRVEWLRPMSAWETQAASASDRAAHIRRAAPLAPRNWWRRAWGRARRTTRDTKKAQSG